VRRGEVWEAVLHPPSGSEQSGKRPVVVLSNDGFNEMPTWRSILVVPFSTSDKQRARGPTAVSFVKGVGGLRNSSVAVCHQVTTLDRQELTSRLG
jgi:mRNA interferase MazF